MGSDEAPSSHAQRFNMGNILVPILPSPSWNTVSVVADKVWQICACAIAMGDYLDFLQSINRSVPGDE
jgi:hypothetical protein